jgi:hypothetical protein
LPDKPDDNAQAAGLCRLHQGATQKAAKEFRSFLDKSHARDVVSRRYAHDENPYCQLPIGLAHFEPMEVKSKTGAA